MYFCFTGIEFDEFLDMYRRLFVLCRSVVSHDVSDLVPPHRLQGSLKQVHVNCHFTHKIHKEVKGATFFSIY